MKNLILSIFVTVAYFHLMTFILGIGSGLQHNFYYKFNEKEKTEILQQQLNLIKKGFIIQEICSETSNVSYYSIADRKWYLQKIFDFALKWTVFYKFYLFNLC